MKSSLLRSLAISCVLMTATVGSSAAQDVSAEHLQAARQMIAAIEATDPYDVILPGVAQQLKTELIQNNPDLEQQLLDIVDEETLALAARRGDLENEAAAAYARVFSQEDLEAIAAFYETTAGQALLSNGPLAAREVAQAAAIWQRGIERDLMESVGRRLGEAGLRPAPSGDGETVPAE